MTMRGRGKTAGQDGQAPLPSPDGNDPELRGLIDQLPLWRRPGYLIRRLHQLHYALFFEECAGTDITPVQYGLMTILSTNPGSDQIAIANSLGIDRTNVADVLRRLHDAGLVERQRSEKDKRAVVSRLTPPGRSCSSSSTRPWRARRSDCWIASSLSVGRPFSPRSWNCWKPTTSSDARVSRSLTSPERRRIVRRAAADGERIAGRE